MKTKVKIILIVLMIGWFPFMWLAILGRESVTLALITVFTGFIICFSSAVILNTYLKDAKYWKSMEEIEELKEKYEKAYNHYRMIADKLVKRMEE